MLLLLAATIFSCVPPREEEILTDVRAGDWSDPINQKIYNFQDQLLSDSLYTYFSNPDPTYRYAAAMAFASVRDSSAVDSLGALLKDPVPQVRQAAAYALGQIGAVDGVEALLAGAFDRYDSLGLSTAVNATILEAIGKSGGEESLEYLAAVQSYRPSDTLLLLGQARGIYRFALRGITTEAGTERMIALATGPKFPKSARLIAGHYLARAARINLDTFAGILARTAPGARDADLRMALALALGKARRPVAVDTLINWFQQESDYRVKVNLLRAMAGADYERTSPVLFAALRDGNLHVANRAAQMLLDFGNARDAGAYWRASRDSLLAPLTKATLLAAAQRHLPAALAETKTSLNNDCRRRFEYAKNPYNKAAYLRALGEHSWNYRYIFRVADTIPNLVVRTAAAEALAGISSLPNFQKVFGLGWKRTSAELAGMFRAILRSGDVGAMAIAAAALRHPDRNYVIYLDTLSFLDSALTRLELPRDQETYQEIQRTATFLRTGKDAAPAKPAFNHPIPWKVVTGLKRKPQVEIETVKGRIRLELLPKQAPGSVANFVELARKGFFNGKNFHRVAPNFVIQGGCPRGDGYGALGYTIRSELGPAYYDAAGYVGMASAGNHTEGTQFFITHSPTPHLDGNYTIFARVIEGMEVVHAIQVGDVIEKVTIL